MRCATRLVVVGLLVGSLLVGTGACGSGATATVDESDASADTQVELDADAMLDSADASDTEASASDVAPMGDAGSRCTFTANTVACTHNVTTLTPSATIRRDVYWQTPLGAVPAGGHPVVVLFQGSFAAPSITWGTLTKGMPFGGYYQGVLQARLLERGFTVIAPSATGGLAWQTNAGGNWTDTQDHVVMQTLLAEIKAGSFGPADMKRLYATGISSGGYMTSRMAVSYAGTFRALAIQSGSYATCLGAACALPATLPANHPPTLFLHGALDTTVPQWTAKLYFDKLVSDKVESELDVDAAAGHEWLPVSPERITRWFVDH